MQFVLTCGMHCRWRSSCRHRACTFAHTTAELRTCDDNKLMRRVSEALRRGGEAAPAPSVICCTPDSLANTLPGVRPPHSWPAALRLPELELEEHIVDLLMVRGPWLIGLNPPHCARTVVAEPHFCGPLLEAITWSVGIGGWRTRRLKLVTSPGPEDAQPQHRGRSMQSGTLARKGWVMST